MKKLLIILACYITSINASEQKQEIPQPSLELRASSAIIENFEIKQLPSTGEIYTEPDHNSEMTFFKITVQNTYIGPLNPSIFN